MILFWALLLLILPQISTGQDLIRSSQAENSKKVNRQNLQEFLPIWQHAEGPVKIDEGSWTETGICEPSISIDPTRPEVIYAASVLNNFYESLDGGRTWKKEEVSSPYGVWGDPCLLTDLSGRLYYFHLSDPDTTNWSSPRILDRIVCQTKDGPGYIFSEGSFTAINGKKHDKEWAALNPQNGNIALAWTQFDQYGTPDPDCTSRILFSQSTDRGLTWSPPLQPSSWLGNCEDDDQTTEGAVPAYGIKGEIYIGWALGSNIFMSKSRNGKDWKSSPIARIEAGWSQSYPGFSRSNGMPITVVDHCPTSPYHGRVYVCWGDQNNKLGGEIYLIFSDNKGKTWSEPTRISKGGKSDQFMPWITTDPTTGYLYAVYYDRRNTKEPNETNTYLAISKDGGTSWVEKKINQDPFFPSDQTFMGDYNHISAHSGIVRPIWTELSKDGLKSIWTYLYQD